MGTPRGLFLSSGSFALQLNTISVKLLANSMALGFNKTGQVKIALKFTLYTSDVH
jgi:hypothetical protein